MNNNFLWGGATASYQCEGAWNVDDKAESMWDYYLHEAGLENGDVASDHYHRYEEDIRMMKEGGQNSYRFSLSWPRIIKNRQGGINLKGIEFYQNLLDTCKKYDIEPFVTLYHWDLPQYWEETGGWLDHDVCAAFEHYAKVCYDHFGDKITNWTTFNEPKWFVANGYKIGNYPPGYQDTQKTLNASNYRAHVMATTTQFHMPSSEARKKMLLPFAHLISRLTGVVNRVKLVLLLTMKEERDNSFEELFGQLVTILNERSFVKKLAKQEDFQQFIELCEQKTLDS